MFPSQLEVLKFALAAASACSPVQVLDLDKPAAKGGQTSVYLSSACPTDCSRASLVALGRYAYSALLAGYLIGFALWSPAMLGQIDETNNNKSTSDNNTKLGQDSDNLARFYLLALASTNALMCFCGLSLAARRRPLRLAALSLLVAPQCERARLATKLAHLLNDTFSLAGLADPMGLLKLTNHASLRLGEPANLLRALDYPKLHLAIMPSCLDSANRRAYFRVINCVFWTFLVQMTLGHAYCGSNLLIRQLDLRLANHLARARNELLHLGSHNQFSQQREELFWLENKHHYYQHYQNNSSQRNFGLYTIELRHLAGQAHFWLILCNCIGYLVTFTWWFLVFMMAFVSNYHFQWVWLGEIRQQMQSLSAMVAKQKLHLQQPGWQAQAQLSFKKTTTTDDYDNETRRLGEIHRAIVIGLANYKLFRSQYEDFRWFANNLINFEMLHNASLILWVYIAYISNAEGGGGGDGSVSLMVYMSLGSSLLVVNGFFISSSLILDQFARINVTMLQCSAHLGSLSLSLSDVVRLLNKHMTSESNLRHLHSLRFFGVELSRSNFITFNLYLFGILLLIYDRYTTSST